MNLPAQYFVYFCYS